MNLKTLTLWVKISTQIVAFAAKSWLVPVDLQKWICPVRLKSKKFLDILRFSFQSTH